VRAAGCQPVADLDAALPRADFVVNPEALRASKQ
jgi:hypothetical protein